ncbi:hypothetical protein N9Y17_04265 [Gammaproteobacteria bacterium]|nr:hypothetical protein [Gammaproteobacteria bacterium]
MKKNDINNIITTVGIIGSVITLSLTVTGAAILPVGLGFIAISAITQIAIGNIEVQEYNYKKTATVGKALLHAALSVGLYFGLVTTPGMMALPIWLLIPVGVTVIARLIVDCLMKDDSVKQKTVESLKKERQEKIEGDFQRSDSLSINTSDRGNQINNSPFTFYKQSEDQLQGYDISEGTIRQDLNVSPQVQETLKPTSYFKHYNDDLMQNLRKGYIGMNGRRRIASISPNRFFEQGYRSLGLRNHNIYRKQPNHQRSNRCPSTQHAVSEITGKKIFA